MYRSLIGILIFLLLLPGRLPAADFIEHRLKVHIDPQAGTISVNDRLTLPDRMRGKRLKFRLHPALQITKSRGGQLTTDAPGHHTFTPDDSGLSPELSYHGRIHDPLRDISDSPGKTQQVTRGRIGPEGVFLSGASAWYPQIDDLPVVFDLEATLPEGWLAISQGKAVDGEPNYWREHHPQEEIYLVAGRYRRYLSNDNPVRAEGWLRQPDAALARRYLDATEQYIAHYGELLGHYPYAKFALVENFWESGYGMPSFTLLGPTVIRLPFIIHTSYPHEIVHNWFGNGVYVDWQGGNWSEGLTTYLADHHLREQRGAAAAYRRDQLKSWADHASGGHDFPLVEFTGRHGDASQAVGYGKAMMFFHMIRRKIGDEAFFSGLRHFVADKLFRRAGYDDLRLQWEKTSGIDLKPFFRQWLHRSGAPRLAINEISLVEKDGHYHFGAVLEQTQAASPFPLTVPIRFNFGVARPAITKWIDSNERRTPLAFDFDSRPIRVEVDPEYDCFRQLYPGENPLTLSSIFGSNTATLILPANAPPALRDGYRALAEQWAQKRSGKWRIVTDEKLKTLPDNGAIIVLGWTNRFAQQLLDGKTLERIAGHDIDRNNDSIVLTSNRRNTPTLLIATPHPAALPGLTRKLPHYGKYSYLVFEGDAPTIRVKGQWPSADSPLVRDISLRAVGDNGSVPALAPVSR